MIRNFLLVQLMLAVVATGTLCRAQNPQPGLDSAIEVLRADVRADRVTTISAAMNFSDKDAEVFWPIYRKYEHERSSVDDRRVAVIKEYTAKYPNLSDSDAKAMAERMFDCESRLIELKKRYFKQFNKALPAFTVTKFFQLEHRMDLLMDLNVESSLPPLAGSEAQQQDDTPRGNLLQQ